MAERTEPNRDDPPSDLIKLDSGIASIPDHVEFVPTPEEIRQARILRILKITGAAVAIAAIVFGTYGFVRHRSRSAAIAEACRHGRVDAFESALALTDDEGTAGWLRGAGALTKVEGELDAAALESVQRAASAGSIDAKLAGAYAALLAGDAAKAHAEAEGLTLAGDLAPEIIFVQSLAAEASGRVEHAVARASLAHQLHPDSTRYLARWAIALVRAGHPDDAIARLGRASGDSPDVALARARAELAKGGDPAPANASARRVLDDASATPAERGWASLVTGLGHLVTGDRTAATAAIDEARGKVPVADEHFRLRLAEALLALGRAADAEAALAPVAERAESSDPALRALVRGRIALAQDDVAKAAEVLRGMPNVPERAFLEAGVAEGQGSLDQASEAYLGAARVPALRATALAHAVRVEIAREQPEAAVRHAEALLAENPNHPDYVPVAIDAFAANADLARARTLLDAAARAHGEDLRIEHARGRLHLAAAEWDRALAVLGAVAERTPNDSAVQVDLGDAARRSGDAARAEAAYARAIELRPKSVPALLGLLELALDRADVDASREKLERIDALVRSSDDPRLLHLRARYLVASGAGDAGIDILEPALRVHRRDGALRVAVGELCLQAEQYAQAARYFDAALRLEGVDPREALAGIALAHALGRRLGTAERALEQALEQASTESADPATRFPRTPAALAAIEARQLVTQGRLDLLEDHGAAARRSVARALERAPQHGDALLLDAELAVAAETITPDQLRRAWLGRPRQPRAAGRLAIALGAGDEGCALARAYLAAAPRGEHASEVRAVANQCPGGR